MAVKDNAYCEKCGSTYDLLQAGVAMLWCRECLRSEAEEEEDDEP